MKKSPFDPYTRLGLVLGVGSEIGISVVGSLFGGYWLDRYLETSPLFLIIFVSVGGAIAFRTLLRLKKWFEDSD